MHDFPLLTTIAAAFAAAWVLGLITQRIGLSPIVGYLLAGIVIGPHTPGFTGDVDLAQQLAEVGVILLMFGVGLHFHLKDLLAVKGIAIPGAIGQSLVATVATAGLFYAFDWPIKSGVVLGFAMAVASTVVLLRVLMDRSMLNTVHGHVAVGWLIVEDIFTVLVLVLIPIIGTPPEGGGQESSGIAAIGWAFAKLIALVAIVLFAGSKVVPWILTQVARLRSPELFTLTVLVLSIAIAVGAAKFFGASPALGAFLAGMVVAQSPVSHQAAADALPLRDAFAVIFFVAVGMLFDPSILRDQPMMVAAGLAIVLIAKPLAAIAIVAMLGYTARTALTVAIGLAQIGEFSFILSQVASDYQLLPEAGHNVIVATAIISISINPLLFRALPATELWLQKRPALWKLLNARANRRVGSINSAASESLASVEKPMAIIVGYGPVGRVVDALLRDAGLHTVIIDLNMDTVQSLTRAGRSAIYGDASRAEVLSQAGIGKAAHLVLTMPHSAANAHLVHIARDLNPKVEVTVRAKFLAERETLSRAGVNRVVFDEGEAGVELARHIMERRQVDPSTSERLLDAIRKLWGMKN